MSHRAGSRWLLAGPEFETVVRWVLFGCTALSVCVAAAIAVVLMYGAAGFFVALARDPLHSVLDFFVDREWAPGLLEPRFGVRPLLRGTLLVTVGSGLIALPLGLATAVYLAEYAGPRFRRVAKPLLELFAGIPSVVYGYVAVVFVSPILQWALGAEEVNALNASLVVALMILPTVISLSHDVLRMVPQSIRDAAYALGASQARVTTGVVIPAALSGIVASFLLAISRAIGETMAVTMAAGSQPNLTFNFLERIETMTAEIVKITSGEAPADSVEYQAIFAIGLTLFVCTLAMNVIAQGILRWMYRRFE